MSQDFKDPSAYENPYQSHQTGYEESEYQGTGEERLGDNLAIRMLIPVGRSGFAIAAGYLGLFSFIILPAPLALIFGILAIWHIQRSKKKGKRLHGMGRAIFGLVMGLLGTSLLLFGLFAAVMGW